MKTIQLKQLIDEHNYRVLDMFDDETESQVIMRHKNYEKFIVVLASDKNSISMNVIIPNEKEDHYVWGNIDRGGTPNDPIDFNNPSDKHLYLLKRGVQSRLTRMIEDIKERCE